MGIVETAKRRALIGIGALIFSTLRGARLAAGKRLLTVCALAFVIAMLISAVLPTRTLWAQEESLSIKSMKVSVWPEYDDPRILVIYDGEFSNGSSFPQDVKFLAPVVADINQVCALRKPENEHLCQLYQTQEEDGALSISYSLPIPTYFLEYYYSGLEGQTDKAFTYEFQSPYPIDNLVVEVQQPLRSTGFNLTPDGAVPVSGSGGFKYYIYSFDDVAPDQAISIDASYTKSDGRPSISNPSGQQDDSGGSSLAIVLGIIIAAAMGVIGWLALSRRRSVPQKATAAAGHARKAKPIRLETPDAGAKNKTGKSSFCSRCGSKLDEDDNFCPSCGAKVKRRS